MARDLSFYLGLCLPLGLASIVFGPLIIWMIYRKINRSPPSLGDPTHGDNQMVAWGPVCEPIGDGLKFLWRLLTTCSTRRPNRNGQSNQHGQVEAVDGHSTDEIEMENVNGRPKNNDEERQAPVIDDEERPKTPANSGEADVPVQQEKVKNIWNKLNPFGNKNRTVAGPEYADVQPGQLPRLGRSSPSMQATPPEHAGSSLIARAQRRDEALHVTEAMAEEYKDITNEHPALLEESA